MRRLRRIISGLALLLLLYLLGQIWLIHSIGNRDDGGQADCAIVLGAAAWDTKPSPVLRERLNHAILLYHEKRVAHLILTGGYGEGAPYSESQVSRDYCISQGVDPADIHIEKKSGTTLENLREAKDIISAQNWQNALLVSDPWHLRRAQAMAHSLELDTAPSATRTSLFKSLSLRAKFILKELLLYHQFLLFGK